MLEPLATPCTPQACWHASVVQFALSLTHHRTIAETPVDSTDVEVCWWQIQEGWGQPVGKKPMSCSCSHSCPADTVMKTLPCCHSLPDPETHSLIAIGYQDSIQETLSRTTPDSAGRIGLLEVMST